VASSATVKLVPVNWPEAVIEHTGKAMMLAGVLEMLVHGPTSPLLNPLPVIVTAVPGEPEVGVSVITGAVETKVNVAVAKSPVLPVTVTV